jgi:hypothetical protein
MLNAINFKELETKGFLVIPNFLDSKVLSEIKKKYYEQLTKTQLSTNSNYDIITVYNQIVPEILLQNLLNKINQQTNITVNLIKPITTYFSNQLAEFGWHQDHEPYYMWQDSYNAINCWIPIIKSSSAESGLSIIPQDKLQQCCPDIFKDYIYGKGAKVFNVQPNGVTTMRDDSEGTTTALPFDINTIAESPALNEGDLLILRQDIFHKTQDANKERVAISVRCVNKNTVLTRDKFLSGCDVKHNMIKNNPIVYAKLTQKFINENVETMLLGEL